MALKYIYGVYDGDVMIFEGTSTQIANKFNLLQSTMFTYANRGAKINGKYIVKKLGIYNKVVKEKKKPKSKHELTLEYLIKHLKEYGNTVLNKHPDEYLKELKKSGLNVNIKKIMDLPEFNSKKRKSYFYVLEVKK